MKKNCFRLVFSRVRGMVVAVEETAGAGEACGVAARGGPSASVRVGLYGSVLGALIAAGIVPMAVQAQIVGGGARAPLVIQTRNGLPQVNINRPSGAGVSVNTYQQFDVRKPGAILNNAPPIVQTQQAGMINGNPNFGPGQSARVIVNQVNSRAASQLNGYLEVAGQRAEVVIANGSGISVHGGGFINTSRATLVTGTPVYGADGSLASFNVTGGRIAVQGAGLNASNVDQVELLARAVQVNAAIHADRLNVVAGANAIDRESLHAVAIQGDGDVPVVAVDVSALGAMDANLSVPFALGGQAFLYVTTVHGQYTDDTLFYIDNLAIGSRYTVRGFDGETMLAAERGLYGRNELQWPVLQTGQTLYAGLDYGRVFGPNAAYLVRTQLAGAVLGMQLTAQF